MRIFYTQYILLLSLILIASSANAEEVDIQKMISIKNRSVALQQLNKTEKEILNYYNSTKDLKKTIKFIHKNLHTKILKKYELYSSFENTIMDGKYDCVTASILYAYFLEKLNIPYEVHEKNYHIYLTADLKGKAVLIEGTSNSDGLVFGKNNIRNREIVYKKINQSELKKESKIFRFEINETISFEQLCGLNYYNLAVVEFNEHHFSRSINILKISQRFYSAKRTEVLMLLAKDYLQQQHLAKN